MSNGLYFAAAIGGIILHEAGHVLACKYLGVQVKKFGLSRRGAYVVHAACAPADHALIASAGPVMNLLLAAVLPADMALPNLILGVVYLLPFSKSDGRTILNYFQKSA